MNPTEKIFAEALIKWLRQEKKRLEKTGLIPTLDEAITDLKVSLANEE